MFISIKPFESYDADQLLACVNKNTVCRDICLLSEKLEF